MLGSRLSPVPTAPVVAQTGVSPDTYQRLPNMRKRERERESTHATPTQCTSLMYKKQRKKRTRHQQRHEYAQPYIYYKSKIQLRLRARLREVRLQQQSAAKPPFGELLGLSRRAGSCIGDRVVAKPFRTCELLVRLSPKRTRALNTHNDAEEEEEEEENPSRTLPPSLRRPNFTRR